MSGGHSGAHRESGGGDRGSRGRRLPATLRRVFYALVAEGKTPNTTQAYKRLSWTLDEARWEGLLPLDALDDRARPVSVAPAWESPAQIVRACARQFRSDWWADADTG